MRRGDVRPPAGGADTRGAGSGDASTDVWCHIAGDHNDTDVARDTSARRALADRHADTLGGRLAALRDVCAADVCLVVSVASARTRAGQLLATQAANLLGRMEGVIATLAVVVEGDDPGLMAAVDPRVPPGSETLTAAVRRSAALASPERLGPPDGTRPAVRVGVGVPRQACDLYASAGAWGVYVGGAPGPECVPTARGAVGAFVAASFVAGEVFRRLRATGRFARGPERFAFDAWAWRPVPVDEEGVGAAADSVGGGSPRSAGSPRLASLDVGRPDPWRLSLPPCTLAGVGAVGSALLLTLWASGSGVEATLVDGDTVSLSNLNRYVLFARADRGHMKVARAAALLTRAPGDAAASAFVLTPFADWWSAYQRVRGGAPEPLVISGVDTNTARHQLQDALPGLILGASTRDLRVEVARYALGDARSRCLKCHNTPEGSESDLVVQRRLLGLDAPGLVREAEDSGVPLAQLEAYVAELRGGGTGCAVLAGPALDKLRRRDGEGAFAVSFVSNLAGALLAAQLIREAVGAPLLAPPYTRAVFQLFRLDAESNRAFEAPIDTDCWCQQRGVRAAHRSTWPVTGSPAR